MRSYSARGNTPRTSASGCAASRVSLALTPSARPMTSPPTFSKWSALGNVYWLVERADLDAALTPARVRELGADGVIEVVAAAHDEAEIVIWNPDGSTAELSGNGTRIAARWLMERNGHEAVRIRVGPRVVAAHATATGEIEQDMGE